MYLRMCADGAMTGPWIRIVAADLLRRIDPKADPKK
jgi:hypothetical protein